jgi:hypothetical protein
VGLILQVTPAGSLVVATTVRVCVTARPARAGEMATEPLARVTVIFRVTLFVCAGLPESVAANVSGMPAAVAAGVPEMVPLEANARPDGRAPPVSVQV